MGEYGHFNTSAVPASVDIMGFSCRHDMHAAADTSCDPVLLTAAGGNEVLQPTFHC